MKVLVENNNRSIVAMFEARGWEVVRHKGNDCYEGVDLICFEGGADVTPSLYGEDNVSSFNDPTQDLHSVILYNNAKRLNIPMVGICRGGQFLNVMAGGKMIQHYDGHAIVGTHEILYFDKDDIKQTCKVTSTHHQVMKPNLNKQNLIGWAGGDWQEGTPVEAEIVWNWEDDSFSFQPHPEYVEKGHECQELFFNLLANTFGLRV